MESSSVERIDTLADIYKKILKQKDDFYQEYVNSFNENGFLSKEHSTFDIMNQNAELEFAFLEHIRKVADSINVKFYPSNWPQGFRGDSRFYGFVGYRHNNNNLDIYNTFIINIWQSSTRCRVMLGFPPLYHPEIILAEALEKIKRPVRENVWLNNDLQILWKSQHEEFEDIDELIEINNRPMQGTESLFNDLNVLAQTSKVELEQIGLEFGSKGNHLSDLINDEINKKTLIYLEDVIRFLEIKHEYNQLFTASAEDCTIIEGIILFESLYKSNSPAPYRDIEKKQLRIRLCNKTKNVVLINNLKRKELTISQLLNHFRINHNISDEIKTLLDLSTNDLNIINLLLEQVD